MLAVTIEKEKKKILLKSNVTLDSDDVRLRFRDERVGLFTDRYVLLIIMPGGGWGWGRTLFYPVVILIISIFLQVIWLQTRHPLRLIKPLHLHHCLDKR